MLLPPTKLCPLMMRANSPLIDSNKEGGGAWGGGLLFLSGIQLAAPTSPHPFPKAHAPPHPWASASFPPSLVRVDSSIRSLAFLKHIRGWGNEKAFPERLTSLICHGLLDGQIGKKHQHFTSVLHVRNGQCVH